MNIIFELYEKLFLSWIWTQTCNIYIELDSVITRNITFINLVPSTV